MGVVIGETTIIGDDVTLYQGVTLGGTGKETGKRHPTLRGLRGRRRGAAVLGDITIGHGSKVGGGAVVIDDVPPNCTVVGVPGRVVMRGGSRVDAIDLHHEDLPDPVVEMFRCLQRRMDRLETKLVASGGTVDGDDDGPERHREGRRLADPRVRGLDLRYLTQRAATGPRGTRLEGIECASTTR